MAKKASLSTLVEKLVEEKKKPVIEPRVDISEEALLVRIKEKKTLPFKPLIFTYTGISAKVERELEFDFNPLVEGHPQYKYLINQLLVGIALLITPGESVNKIKKAHNAIPSFINFLTDKNNLNNTIVTRVADIDTFVLQSYKTYLLSNFPKKTTNSRYYSSIVNSCKILIKKYPDESLTGEFTTAPTGPSRTDKAMEGYNRFQMKALIKCCIKDIRDIRALHLVYDALNNESPRLFVVPNGYNKDRWRNDPEQHFLKILATIKTEWPEYPFFITIEKVQSLFDRNGIKNDYNNEERKLRIRIDKALGRCSGKISFMNGTIGRGTVFAAMHFVSATIFPIILLSQIITGFNLECLKYLIDNLDEHINECIIDPKNYVIIWGYKGKTDKLVPFRCKKNQANGAYSLLKYVENKIKIYKDSPHYVKGLLFQFIRETLNMREDFKGLMCTFVGNNMLFRTMSLGFIKRHNLEKLIGTSIDSRKIRSGFATIALEGGMTSHQVADQLGHQDSEASPETAEKSYISDAASVAIKNNVISSIQKRMVADICNLEQRIVTSVSLQLLRNSINLAKNEAERRTKIHNAAKQLKLEEKTIIHLLDTGSQTYILACEDMANPTWVGNENFVKNGQCRQFNKCCMCRQAVIFSDALPYIAKRIIDLEDFQNKLTATEWIVNFGDEYDAWSGILNNWNNNVQVENAWKTAKSGKIFLPKIMKGGVQ